MRSFIIVLVIVLAVVFVGGTISVGGNTIFGHIDSLLGTTVLTSLHQSIFFFIYTGAETVEEGLTKTEEDLQEFEKRPIGIDNKKRYKQLDDAAKY